MGRHLADPIVTPQNTLDYYSAIEKAAGGSVADHFRLITEAGFDPLTALENGSRTALRRTACSRPRRTRTATSCGRGRCARFHKKRCIEERATPRTPPTIAARRRRGVELSTFGVSKPEEIAPAINATKASGAEAINFLATPLFSVPGSPNNRIVLEAVLAARLPAIYQWPETAEEGGLAAYGPRFTQVYRQRARQVVKVLRGAKVADLPIEQPSTFELVINLKAAKSLGIEVSPQVIAQADETIE